MPHFITSESVTEGHPDKVCDQISDAILDAYLKEDPTARVACETMIASDLIVVTGEITSHANIDVQKIIRSTTKRIGYDTDTSGFNINNCEILVHLNKQSADISAGVSNSLELRTGATNDAEAEMGAGDQGMMIGFACDETPELMPLTISLAHQLAKCLATLRKNQSVPWLLPDGKSQVTISYNDEWEPIQLESVVISTQHTEATDLQTIQKDVQTKVIEPILNNGIYNRHTKVFINPSGRFVIGGPQGDTGLTGRKIIVDTYGGVARHGGGAFSGKDPSKVDRSASYAARWVAKTIVAAGLAKRCEFTVSYAIGVAEPMATNVELFGTGRVSKESILAAVKKEFDLRPAAIIRDLDLTQPIYENIAAYGHFGRAELNLPWENTSKADSLAQHAKLAHIT